MSDVNNMTAEQIEAAITATVCLLCGKAKARSVPFCSTDFAALPLASRLALNNPEQRHDAFRSACRHLELNRYRKFELNSWPYTQDSELYDAGFVWIERLRCPAPGCGKQVSFWRTPDRKGVIVLDEYTRQPHRLDCADFDYFRRQREEREAKNVQVQTFARRRR
jgi:hypothetical protein